MKFTVTRNFGNYKVPITYNKIPKSSKKMTKFKAYLLGVLCGDGYLYFNPDLQIYQIALQAVDKDFVILFQKYLEKVYHLKVPLSMIKSKNKNWNIKYQARLCSKIACLDLLAISNSYRTEKWVVPNKILKSSKIIKSYFLKGFYDSEGNVDIKSKRISLTSINEKGLKQIRNILYEFGIRSTITKRNKVKGNRNPICNLQIHDRKSVACFFKKIFFGMQRKNRSLQILVNCYKFTSTPHIEVLKNVEEMRKLRSQAWPYQKIANKFKVSVATVWNNLN